MNRLFVDLKEVGDEVGGTIKFPHDGAFTLEALLVVIEQFAQAVGRPSSEMLADLYSHAKARGL